MASNNENQTSTKGKKNPDFNVSQIIPVPGREKDIFQDIGVGFENSDGSINLLTVHGTIHVRVVKSKK